jgi:phospholipid transport system substrate-binding protein
LRRSTRKAASRNDRTHEAFDSPFHARSSAVFGWNTLRSKLKRRESRSRAGSRLEIDAAGPSGYSSIRSNGKAHALRGPDSFEDRPEMNKRLIVSSCLAVTFALLPAGSALAEGDGRTPSNVVEAFHGILIETMKESDTLGYEQRREKIRPSFDETFDMDFMAEKSSGRAWRDFTDDQKRQWIGAFSAHTLANYAGRFKGFNGQSFETHGEEEAPSDTILVKTTLRDPGGEDVQLNYRLRETPAGWRVVDIYMHGTVSELALRRAEYSTALGRDGIDATIAKLTQQTEDLSVKNGG